MPVGLFGLHRKTNFVFEEIRFSISSKSYPLSAPTGTQLTDAPHCSANFIIAKKVGCPEIISPPFEAKVRPVIFNPSVEPPVTIIDSGSTPCFFAKISSKSSE